MPKFFLIFSIFTALPLSISADEFSDYWYNGKAEIAHYELSQSRYGSSRKGYAVAIWVTEDFSLKNQVKLDSPNSVKGEEKTKVLKLNFLRRFQTGIYDYSLMSSLFQPVQLEKFRYPLKTTFSLQDWCGQTFAQQNLKNNNHEIEWKSYFESQGDKQKLFRQSYTEDQIWTLIRLNPSKLPQGNFEILPALSYFFLEHQELELEQAKAILKKINEDYYSYRITFLSSKRVVEWRFHQQFPHVLKRWEERYYNSQGKQVVNSGKLVKTVYEPYWSLAGNKDEKHRDVLGIPPIK